MPQKKGRKVNRKYKRATIWPKLPKQSIENNEDLERNVYANYLLHAPFKRSPEKNMRKNIYLKDISHCQNCIKV